MAKYAHILLEKSLFFKRPNTFVGSVFDYLVEHSLLIPSVE